jgi:hypothetical protein
MNQHISALGHNAPEPRVPTMSACLLLLAWTSAAFVEPEDQATSAHFWEQVAPLLERRCVSCHNDVDRKGGLSLQSFASLQRGGDSGPVVTPGMPDASLLLSAVMGDRPEMPKTGSRLSATEVAALREWIASGAHFPADVVLQERPAADLNWWSLRPLQRPNVPRAGAEWARNPIDCFIAERWQSAGLTPSPEADRRTLIRRLYFDLWGLPPTPQAVAEFLADPHPDAYERLVDRLLASPHFGERWARHWLDVVHYGDTHGYDKDKPRPHAWPYRDYVIRAFNSDKPYAQFVTEQLAGDVVAPGMEDGITALGFIAAGPWDFISHVEVPESKIDGQLARSLDRDDMVVNTLNTFCSVTVQCARCHAHKFDPVSQVDYYRLQAVFAALDRADKPYDTDPAVAVRRQSLLAAERQLVAEQQQAVAEFVRQGGPELAALDRRLHEARQAASTSPHVPPEFGYHSQIELQADRAKWVQVDLGASVEIARVVLFPCHDTFNNIGSGFGFPRRWKVELADDPEFSSGVRLLVDRTDADVPNPGLAPQSHAVPPVAGRYVRVTATRLAPRQNDFIFALAELQVFDTAGTNRALGQPVTALDAIEAAPRWRRSNLVDGLFPRGGGEGTADVVAQLERERSAIVRRTVSQETRAWVERVQAQLTEVRRQLQTLPAQAVVYAGTVHTGSGNFAGTGANGGKPRPIHVLARGDVRRPGELVRAGAPPFVPGFPAEFELDDQHPESARRKMLADWIVHRDHPLTWRSIVNRLWQYHFGRGLVDSPNDFGRMGQKPTHPELLDWLAVELRDGGQSLKRVHRLIVTSAAYRQVSRDRPECSAQDAGNALLWRAPRRRLEAEAVRDSLLFVAGRLDDRMYGPGFQDFVVERPEHSPHYEYHLHDPRDPRSHRRSVYRFLVRSQPQPFMTTLDCADPSMSVDKRNETINALQALALLNNGLTLVMAEEFARSVAPVGTLEDQLTAAFERAVSRSPTPDECSLLLEYARQHGLPNTCRLLLNLNEFVFVD